MVLDKLLYLKLEFAFKPRQGGFTYLTLFGDQHMPLPLESHHFLSLNSHQRFLTRRWSIHIRIRWRSTPSRYGVRSQVQRCNRWLTTTRAVKPHSPFPVSGDRWRRLNGVIWFVIGRWRRLSQFPFDIELSAIYPCKFSHWPERIVEAKG